MHCLPAAGAKKIAFSRPTRGILPLKMHCLPAAGAKNSQKKIKTPSRKFSEIQKNKNPPTISESSKSQKNKNPLRDPSFSDLKGGVFIFNSPVVRNIEVFGVPEMSRFWHFWNSKRIIFENSRFQKFCWKTLSDVHDVQDSFKYTKSNN